MRIALGADHAGFPLKEHLRSYLEDHGHQVEDFGTGSEESTDYPDYARLVGEAVADGTADRGLLVCGTGIGMAIAANKVLGVRAANCFDPYACRMGRAHNNANVLTLPGRMVAAELADEIVRVFLETPFEGGRHQRRVDKIHAIEN